MSSSKCLSSSSTCLPPPALCVGDRICYQMKGDPQIGLIKWIGVLPEEITTGASGRKSSSSSTSFMSSPSSLLSSSAAPVLYAGVEFFNPVGSGNGAVKVKQIKSGKAVNHTIQYFQCRKNHAGFVKLSSLAKAELGATETSRRHNDSIGSLGSSVTSSNGASTCSSRSFSRMSISLSFGDNDEDDLFESDEEMEALLAEVSSPQMWDSVSAVISPVRSPTPSVVSKAKVPTTAPSVLSSVSSDKSFSTSQAFSAKSSVSSRTSFTKSLSASPNSSKTATGVTKAKSNVTSALTRSSDERTVSDSSPGAGREWVIHPIFGAVPPEPTPEPQLAPKRKSFPVLPISKCGSNCAKPSPKLQPTSPASALNPSNVPSNYKSAICSYWQQTGNCPMEEVCNFAHGNDERRFWDAQLRKGHSIAPRGAGFNDDDDNGDARVTRVKKTYRNDGQFSSNAFAKDKADLRKGGRILTSMSK